jgi:dienelactone hydrolase
MSRLGRAARAGGLLVLVALGGACGTDTDGGTATDTSRPTDPAGPTATAPGSTATDPTAAAAPTTTAPDPSTAGAAEPFEVEELTLELVDDARPTPAGASTPEAPTRSLVTRVWYPIDAPGPVPLIVFAHGLDGHPDKFTQLLGGWAAAGFVVAAPAFPLTNSEVPDAWSNFSDVTHQPADLSFVTDEVLSEAADPSSPIAGRLDAERIGVGGLSLGGATTYLVGLNEASRDPRFDAAMVLDGVAGNDEATGTFLEPSGVPAFLAHCATDPVADVSIAEGAYALLAPPKYLVVLDGVCHAEAFEDTAHPLDATGLEITTAFWDAWLAETSDPPALAAVLDRDPAVTWQVALP